IGLDASDAIAISAKTGQGVPDVLEALVARLPPPKGELKAPLRALLMDSWYDSYLGVVILTRVVDGVLKPGMKIRLMSTGAAHEVGYLSPGKNKLPELGPGEIGYLVAQIKTIQDTKIGDTITEDRKPATTALAGFKPSVPVVFCGLFPSDAANYEELRDSLAK